MTKAMIPCRLGPPLQKLECHPTVMNKHLSCTSTGKSNFNLQIKNNMKNIFNIPNIIRQAFIEMNHGPDTTLGLWDEKISNPGPLAGRTHGSSLGRNNQQSLHSV